MNTYTAAELVRLEILQYPNPEGLHPVEANWRDLCRKLTEDLMDLQELLEHANDKLPIYNKIKFTPIVLPKKFTPIVKPEQII